MHGHSSIVAKRSTVIRGGVNNAIAHDSAAKHAAGSAIYVDDIPEPAGTLHAAPGLSSRAHARIRSMDLAKVRAAPGVVLVLTAADIPGVNDVSPIGAGDDPVFAADLVEFHGQVLFAVIADSHIAARSAAKLAQDRIRGSGAGPHRRGCAAGAVLRAAGSRDEARRCGTRHRQRAALSAGRVRAWRAGAFLSRGPGVAGGPGGGWRCYRPLLDPASDRGAAQRRPRPRAGPTTP